MNATHTLRQLSNGASRDKDPRTQRITELRTVAPSVLEYEGRIYDVRGDVFPPQRSYTTFMLLNQASKIARRSHCALDMGCGTGIIACTLKAHGAASVWAIDHHEAAVRNTRVNTARYAEFRDIVVLRSDLFSGVPDYVKFDLAVFNQPYYPTPRGTLFMGMGEDGGKGIITRFLEDVRRYSTDSIVILMPFSSFAGRENDPSLIAEGLGYIVKPIARQAAGGMEHFVYRITYV